MSPRRLSSRRPAVVAATFLLALPAAAQEAEPLQKSDVIRLITGGAYEQGEIAEIVRRSCLTFRPTDRDLEDFRALGAGAEVMRAVEACAAAADAPGAEGMPTGDAARRPAPARPPAAREAAGARPALTLFLSPRRTAVEPGGRAEVVAEVTAGAVPVPGLRLELREGEGVAGEPVAVATTDDAGRATFSVSAGVAPGIRRFSVGAAGVPLHGANLVELETTGAEPGAVDPRDGPPTREPAARGDEVGREALPAAGQPASPPGRTREEMLREAERLSLRGLYGRADALYERLVAENPDDVGILVAHALHLVRTGGHDRAEETLRRAFGLEPRRADVRMAFGWLSLWRGEAEEAVRWYESATEIRPEDPEAWRGLGQALLEAGRRGEARQAYRRARELEGP